MPAVRFNTFVRLTLLPQPPQPIQLGVMQVEQRVCAVRVSLYEWKVNDSNEPTIGCSKCLKVASNAEGDRIVHATFHERNKLFIIA